MNDEHTIDVASLWLILCIAYSAFKWVTIAKFFP